MIGVLKREDYDFFGKKVVSLMNTFWSDHQRSSRFFKKHSPNTSIKRLFIWRWAGPVRWAGSPRWDLTFFKKLL